MQRLMGVISTNYENDAFGALIKERPISSLLFGGRYRMVDFPLSNMVNSGISKVGLITPNSYRSLMDHVGVGKVWSLNRKIGGMFILPGSTYGMKNVRGKFLLRDIINNRIYFDRSKDDTVVLSATNKIFNIDYREAGRAHEEMGADITLIYKKGLVPSEGEEKYLQLDNGIVADIFNTPNIDKSCFLDTVIIGRELMIKLIGWYERLSSLDFMDVVKDNLKNLKIVGYEFKGYVGIVNGIKSYTETSRDLLKMEVQNELFNSDRHISTKVTDAPPAKYYQSAEVKNSIVASGGIIKGTISGSIIFRGVEIEEGAEVKNCILFQNCKIHKGAKLENVICDKSVEISDNINIIGKFDKPIVISKNQMI